MLIRFRARARSQNAQKFSTIVMISVHIAQRNVGQVDQQIAQIEEKNVE